MRLWILALALLTLIPGLGQETATRQQELRVLLCAREMVATGDWVVPRFQGEVRLRKPPLAYWTTAGAMAATGQDDEFVARLPGALFGVATVWMFFEFLLPRLGAWRAGLAAFLLLCNPGFLRYARLAETDGTQLFFIVVAVFCLQAALDRKRGVHFFLLAGVGMGLGLLAKSPAAVAVPAGLAMFGILRDHLDRPGRKIIGLLGSLLVCAAVAVPWFLKVHEAAPGALGQTSQDLDATFRNSAHSGPVWYYLLRFPFAYFPAGLLAFWALYQGRRISVTHDFYLARRWFLLVFVLISLTVSKQNHYALLLLPPAAMLGATLFPEVSPRFRRRAAGWACLIPVLMGLWSWVFYPKLAKDAAIPSWLRAHRAEVAEAPLVHVVGINSAIFDYYLGRHVHNIDSLQAAWKRARPGEMIVQIQSLKHVEDWRLPQEAVLAKDRRGDLFFLLARKL